MIDKIDRAYLNEAFERLDINETEVFQLYFPDLIDFKKTYLNPLVDDDYPSCKFLIHKKTHRLYFVDYTHGYYDVIDFVKKLFNVNYYTACEFIAIDTGVLYGKKSLRLNDSERVYTTPTSKRIRIKRRNYGYRDLEFWKSFSKSVTVPELESKNIFALDAVWIDDNRVYNHKSKEIAFYHHLRSGYNYQAYKPDYFFNEVKFITSSKNKVVGYKDFDRNGEYGILGKSAKCRFFMVRYGLNVINLLGEGYILTEDEFEHLFGNIPKQFRFTLFDNDKTGLHMSWIYRKKFGTIPLLFPKNEEKDFSDNLLKFGESYMLDYIEYYKNELLR